MNDQIPEGHSIKTPVNFAEVQLRNILYHINIHSLVEVAGIPNNDMVHVDSLTDGSKLHAHRSNLYPVLLSEELMKRFRFEVSIYYNGLKFVNGKMILLAGVGWEKDFRLVSDESMGINEPTMSIYYAHDLQNLYEKIEGERLKFV